MLSISGSYTLAYIVHAKQCVCVFCLLNIFYRVREMRIHIVEEDPSLLHLLSVYLKQKGHDVYGHSGHHQCPSKSGNAQSCLANAACAEAVIFNVRYPNKRSIDALVTQIQKECQIDKKKMAIMSPIMT